MKFLKTYTAFALALLLALTFVFPASASSQSGEAEEYVTNGSGAWVKQGDTWVYEMDLTPGEWYYWEEDIPGYTSDAKKETGKKTGQSDREIVVTNTRDLDYGSLTLGKTVTGTAGEDAGPVSEFDFTITLKGDHIKGIQMFGNYTFHDGVAHLKLSHGASAVIEKLPAGTAYTITEEYVPRYSTQISASDNVSGGTTANPENRTVSGVIEKDGMDSILFTNTYMPPTEEEMAKTNSFRITKTVSGNAEIRDMNFTLKLTFQGLEPERTYKITSDQTETPGTFTADRDGDADTTVMIRDGEILTVNALPVGAIYRITELGGDYVAGYQITDANKLNLIHTSAGSSGAKDTPLSTGKETVDEGENITVAFTNEFFRVQKLHLTKKVLDASGAELSTPEKFRFVIEFDKVPSSGFDSSVGFIKAEDGYASVEVLLSGGEAIDFSGIPVGATWQIKEVGNDYLPSYEYKQKAEGTTELVSKNGENTEPRKDLATALETVNEGEDTTVTFTNKKPQEEPKTLTLKKIVTGNFGDKTKAFPFTITLTDKGGTPLSGTFPCEGKVSRLILNEKGQAVVSLSHGESVTIQGIPADAQYTVCETDNGSYRVTVTDVGETSTRELEAANALTDSDAKTPEAAGSMDSENHTVTFTNAKAFPVPTGVLLSVAPYIFIGGAILAFLVIRILICKKQK